VATIKQCRVALDRLAATLDDMDEETRTRHLPRRTVLCTVKDLDVSFTARVDEDGVHDIAQVPPSVDELPPADVRVGVASDDLVALADGQDDFLSAWLHGRVHVSAPMRDMLRLRTLLGF
jgi:predicted lipid carrier protein YhbT